jgi:hypothetical protein
VRREDDGPYEIARICDKEYYHVLMGQSRLTLCYRPALETLLLRLEHRRNEYFGEQSIC